MPVTLSVGLQKKVGQPNYGSLSASCHVEFDVDRSTLEGDQEAFQRKVRGAFAACQQSVEEQLARQQSDPPSQSNGHEQQYSNGNGNGSRQSNGRMATASQVRAIHAIAGKQNLDLSLELNQRFGVARPDDLTIGQASELIDAIKPQSNGTGGRQ